MWLLILIFLIVTLIVGWCFFGYFILVWFMGLFRKKKIPVASSHLPKISVVIPCFNEEGQIISKLNNIRQLDYPKELLEVFFADGGSSDNTVGLLSKEIRQDEPYRIINCPESGKINQLNYILTQLRGKFIVNTDVDVQLSSDALKWIVAEFEGSKDILLVGAYTAPKDAIEIEKYYWSSQNRGRFLENDAWSSSIILAQCYAFRRGFLKAFPEDVIADDIYISFLAHTRGGRIIYSRYVTTVETRCPKSYTEFLPHKFRKSNAFLRESLRFSYLLPEMNAFCKTMFITRISQQLILPWALLFWFLLAGVLLTMFRYDIVSIIVMILMMLFVLTSKIFNSVKLPDIQQKYSFITAIKGYSLTLTVMLATGISYPFFKQNSEYQRFKDTEL